MIIGGRVHYTKGDQPYVTYETGAVGFVLDQCWQAIERPNHPLNAKQITTTFKFIDGLSGGNTLNARDLYRVEQADGTHVLRFSRFTIQAIRNSSAQEAESAARNQAILNAVSLGFDVDPALVQVFSYPDGDGFIALAFVGDEVNEAGIPDPDPEVIPDIP